MWCPHHFSRGGRNSTLSSEDFPHETSQSGHGGGRVINTRASRQDQGGGGETGFRDRSTAVDGSLSEIMTSQLSSTEI